MEQRGNGTITVDTIKRMTWFIHIAYRYSTGNLEKLKVEQNKENKLDTLIWLFSSKETEDDTVDIHIDDRLDTYIIKGIFDTTLGCNYTICHYRLTIFTTVTNGAEISGTTADRWCPRNGNYEYNSGYREK